MARGAGWNKTEEFVSLSPMLLRRHFGSMRLTAHLRAGALTGVLSARSDCFRKGKSKCDEVSEEGSSPLQWDLAW